MLGRLLNLFIKKPSVRNPSKAKDGSAGCYFVNGRLIIYTISKTTAGVGLSERPMVVDQGDSCAVGGAIIQAIALSRKDILHTKGSVSEFSPFLKAAGVRSYKAFMKNAVYIDIEKRGDEFVIQQWKNEGPKDGFAPLPGKQTELLAPKVELLGVSARYALGLASAASVLANLGGTDPNAALPPRRRSEIS